MFMEVQIEDRVWDVWPISVITFVITGFILYRKKRSFSYLFFLSIFWIYLTFVVDSVFFPMAISGAFAEASRKSCPLPSINLMPLYFGPYPEPGRVFLYCIQNIILTVPFGFGVNFIFRTRLRVIALLSLIVGFIFESTQYILSLLLGYCYRVSDINDIIFNFIGSIIGYGLFRIFLWYYTMITTKFQIKHNGIMRYVYKVCMDTTRDAEQARTEHSRRRIQ